MTVVHDEASGRLGLTDAEYLHWNPEDSPVSVHMHLDAVDGIARDVAEGFESLPRRGLEVGGLLLGRLRTGEKTSVWIEQYQRIPCEHKFGPQFLLDDTDKLELEKAAGGIIASGKLAVVGLYRSHTRDGFQLEPADFELVRRYFSDPSDLILLNKPESIVRISARFYVHDSDGGARPAGEAFPFRGHLLMPERSNPGIIGITPPEKPESEIPEARTPDATPESAPTPEPVVRERPRRLVPDFAPSPISETPPEPAAPPLLFATREHILDDEDESESGGKRVFKWAAIVAALLLAGAGLWWILQPGHHSLPVATPAASTEPGRPLGLSVDPMGPSPKDAWRVSWNPNATALHDARTVQLFVRDGDDQNRIDLSANDLAAGVYRYQPVGHDVTFRLEVTDSSGRISAESFRLEQNQATVTPPPPAPKPTAAKLAARSQPEPTPTVIHRTEPRAIHRAPPVIAAGIRPRISGSIPIDVRVHVDEHGRVTSAAPVIKSHTGLNAYLADAAVKAAKQWRFDPARDNGKPVPGTQVIHFVFEK